MHKLSRSVALAILFAGICTKSLATGGWAPSTVLQNGAKEVLGTPEFFWELECKRIAQEFTPTEKRVPATVSDDPNVPDGGRGLHAEFTGRVDKQEFAAALKSGEVKVANPEQAIKQFADARAALDGADEETKTPLPGEPPGEFADYHKGAYAFQTGNPVDAQEAWKVLLARPTPERKHRSTWAAFMLGKSALRDLKYDEAVKYFQETRKLAKEGFADSLGLAADSYGWEALCELELGHAAEAARLYLTQLSLGDVSAVVSLKLLVPDRQVAVFGEARDTEADVTTKKAYGVETVEDALAKAAADAVLRRLVTAHVLAVGVATEYEGDVEKPRPERQAHWLAAIEKANVKQPADAEHLAWVAYSMGRYADAARWLKLSTGKSCAALWLKAKLALRDGKLKDSAALFAEAVHALPEHETLENTLSEGYEMMPTTAAFGDFGTVLLARAEFIQALDAFLEADLWQDAAYVAERCLTTKELLAYTQQHFPIESKDLTEEERQKLTEKESKARENSDRFRDLVGRRLVREDNYPLARTFFFASKQKVLDKYTAALAAGANAKANKQERARALFHAAWIARNSGMELMGTEAGPDNNSEYGSFNEGDLAMVRLTGKTHLIEDAEEGEDATPKPVAFAVPVTAEEKKRLASTKLNPERRYHYRHIAAGLAWKAALLLPDGAEETADVLNTAGNWLKAKHEKAADRFYQAIERRCAKTQIGQEAVKKHWFSDLSGPWSDAEAAREEAEKKSQ